MLVAPVEHGADASVVVLPLGADELVGEPCGRSMSTTSDHTAAGRGGDVDLGDGAGTVLEGQVVAGPAGVVRPKRSK